jgi:hypothetical protein
MMSINMNVSFALNRQIEERVTCQQSQHVIKKTNASMNCGLACAVNINS